MTFEKSCGAIVFRIQNNSIEILLIKNKKSGHWSFPKGHIENGETEHQTAMREVKEETNIDIDIIDDFREIITYSPKKDCMKDVVYFIGEAKTFDAIPQFSEIGDVEWVEIDSVKSKITFENDKNLISKAIPILKENLVLYKEI